MNKGQLVFSIRMEIAAIRQALRDSEEAELSNAQINQLLDRLGYLLNLLKNLES